MTLAFLDVGVLFGFNVDCEPYRSSKTLSWANALKLSSPYLLESAGCDEQCQGE